jgi:hypothetical protein
MAARYALIGAHLHGKDLAAVPQVHAFDLGTLVVSAVAFESDHGIADPGVVRRALEARKALILHETFIAIRFGAAVAGLEEARSRCAPHLERWRRILENRQGMVEVTLRIAGKEKTTRPDRREFPSGGDYLRALHQRRHGTIDPALARQIEAMFAPIATAKRWLGREDGGSELVLLIPRVALEAVGRVADELKASHSQLPFLISGPWPLEAFANEE